METFSLNRQAFAFLVVIAVTVGLMVLLSPFLLLALGGVGVLVLIGVWLKAAVRGRGLLVPFGAAEGALALSSLLFVIGGALAGGMMVARVGWHDSFSLFRMIMPMGGEVSRGRPVGSRSVHYSDPSMNEQLKTELARAGVPFTTETREGKEYVGWTPEYEAAAEAAQKRVREGPFPGGGNSHIPDAKLHKEFTAWLTRKGVKYEVVQRRGEDWVHWEGRQDLVREFMTQKGSDCKKKKQSC